MEWILQNYETKDPSHYLSYNVKFEYNVVDTEDYREDTYEQANHHSNNEVIN